MKLNEMTNQTIVKKIQATNKFEWLTTSNAPNLDLEFYYSHSGNKETAPIIDILLAKGKTEDEVLDIIANICVTKYATKWNRIYDTLVKSDYNAFEDYSKNATIESNTNQDTKTTIKEDSNATTKEEKSIYGFNSDEAVPTDSSNTESTSLSNKATNVLEDKANNTGHSEEVTTGKLGKTSYQDLAKKEVELRLLYNLIDIFFRDIASEMCTSIY